MQNENSIGRGEGKTGQDRGKEARRSAQSHGDLLSQPVNSHRVAQDGEIQGVLMGEGRRCATATPAGLRKRPLRGQTCTTPANAQDLETWSQDSNVLFDCHAYVAGAIETRGPGPGMYSVLGTGVTVLVFVHHMSCRITSPRFTRATDH